MSYLGVLRGYAQKNPETIPSSVLFSHTANSLTLYDAFPKSIFHFLILPRVTAQENTSDLTNLRTLLKGDKAYAKKILSVLVDSAKTLRKEIEDEMLQRYGFKWEIWTGFHAIPSMEHVHLHVLSADLCSPKMKHKKHYNSFNPKLQFFLDVDEVLSWFDAEPSYFTNRARLEPTEYEAILKGDLFCWHCSSSMKNMPTLKMHLQEEWDHRASREKVKARKTKEPRSTAENT